MDDDIGESPRRRMILRRTRVAGGFSASSSTQSESLRAPADEVDDAVDPETVRESVRSGTTPVMPMDPGGSDNPRARLNAVAMAGSSTYAKEYRLQLIHRLLMRNVPLDQIASQLQVSISTIEKDRAELKRRLREAAKSLDINEMVGDQMATYGEISGMAMRVASSGGENNVPTAMKLAAMRTALAANADMTRFLNTAGVFDVHRFRRSEDGASMSDVQMLMQRTAELLQSLDDPPPPVPRPGGFPGMTFDDRDASGSTAEVQEL